MKKRLLVVSLVILLLAIVPIASVSATGSTIPAEGTDEFVPGSWESRTTTDINGNCLIKIKAVTRNWSGTLDGTAKEDVTVFAQGPCEGIYPGKFDDHWYAKGTFVGDVNGINGTFRYGIFARTYAGGGEEGVMIILKGKGHLAKLHGVLHMTWDLGVYTGRIWFGP